MKRSLKSFIALILLLAALIVFVVFDFVNVTFTNDETANKLLNESIPRLVAGIALIAVMVLVGCKMYLFVDYKKLTRDLLWCLPCFLVVVANFPFSAIIGGSAKILRTDLIWLSILKCLAIGLMEEMLFRGLLQDTVSQQFKNRRYGTVLTVIITSVIFALFHLLNLISGADIGATFLQVGYSFLIGAMLSAVIVKTKNIWLCVFLHTVFDIGGSIVTDLGSGNFQDICFWVFTAIAGVICFIHILYYLLKTENISEKISDGEN